MYRRDRPARNGGGLLVYVPDDLCTVTRRRPGLENEAIECLTFELSLEQNKLADRHGAPRPPMTDVGTETAFRLEKAQAFPKK